MLPIKFKAWDSIEGGWCDREWLEDNAKEVLFGWLTLENIPKEIHVCVYTGLKDKNGVEIYEGDILNYPPLDQAAPVEWVEYDAHFGTAGRLLGDGSRCEVIGNIYENLELLEART